MSVNIIVMITDYVPFQFKFIINHKSYKFKS